MNSDSVTTLDYHWIHLLGHDIAPASGVVAKADSVPADTIPADSVALDSVARDSVVSKVDTIPSMFTHTGKSGAMATPAPYNVATDDWVGGCLMGGVVLAIIALAMSTRFVGRQMRNFFYVENDRTTTVPDLPRELWAQGLLVFFCAMMMGVTAYVGYVTVDSSGEWMLPRPVVLLALVMVFVGYFIFKAMLYQFVDWVFFDVKKNEQWNKSQLMLSAMEGLAVAPIVLLLVYGDLSFNAALILVAIVVLLAKILSFYKCFIIFFRRFGALMQIFLYFCALEMVPLAALAGFLVASRELLQYNF